MSMNINEALNIAKQLKNHFRAFEKIDKLLKEGVAIQIFMTEFESQKANMEQEIATLTQERDKASKSLISIEKEKEEAQRNLEELKTKKAQLKGEITQLKGKLGIL